MDKNIRAIQQFARLKQSSLHFGGQNAIWRYSQIEIYIHFVPIVALQALYHADVKTG